MNTRLQVEHPVTEETTGLDIVCAQIEIAQGKPLALQQQDVQTTGHAIECRINAENPFSFTPSPGRVTQWNLPGGAGIRLDTHITQGSTVQPYYDSLIAKVIARGATRPEAIRRLQVALAEMQVEGIETNIPLHQALLQDKGVLEGGVDIHHLEHWLEKRSQP